MIQRAIRQFCTHKTISYWAFLLFPLTLLPLHGSQWPAIRPLAVRYHFSSMQEAKLKTTIQQDNGKSLYTLECYSFQTVPQNGEFMYSGDFECRLHSVDDKDRQSTLLTELPDADKDWESRGRFLVGQLLPPCDAYRNLGSERSFRLRGFRLDLKLRNVTFDDRRESFSGTRPSLKSFDFEVRAEPDSSATSAIAATPSLPRLNGLPKQCQKAFDTLYLAQFRR